MSNHPEVGLTRREILKRGALFGGAVLWTTPVIQTIGMSRAAAQVASPGCYAIKIERRNGEIICDKAGEGAQDCLQNPELYLNGCGSGAIVSYNLTPPGDSPQVWTITLAEGCEFLAGTCTVKQATLCYPNANAPDPVCSWNSETRELTFTLFDISHVEFVICCE
jgi:hypothetical protein